MLPMQVPIIPIHQSTNAIASPSRADLELTGLDSAYQKNHMMPRGQIRIENIRIRMLFSSFCCILNHSMIFVFATILDYVFSFVSNYFSRPCWCWKIDRFTSSLDLTTLRHFRDQRHATRLTQIQFMLQIFEQAILDYNAYISLFLARIAVGVF